MSRFNEIITKLLSTKLARFSGSDVNLDKTTCLEIYQELFDSLVEVFETSKTKLTNESVNYLAQQYYFAITINGSYELDPNIFTQLAKLENIETKELALLAVMTNGSDIAIPLLHEIKRRS